MSWIRGKLSDMAVFQRGYDLTKKEQRDGQYPVVSSSGVTSYHSEYKARGPGVITGRSGTLGKFYFIETDYWPHNTTLFVKDFKGNNPKFVYYYLGLLGIKRFNAGGATPTLNRNHIHNLEVLIPPRGEQDRIVGILDNYDEIIKCKRKKISFIEEFIETLYLEWFVYLRFPGYDETKIIDAVPEGWSKEKVRDCFVLNYGKALAKGDRRNGNVFVIGSSGVTGVHDKPLVSPKGIVVGRKGNVGAIYWLGREFYPIDTVFYLKDEDATVFNYFRLKNSLNLRSTDAAVPGLNRDFVYSQLVLQPEDSITSLFENIGRPMMDLIDLERESCIKLDQAKKVVLNGIINEVLTV